MRTVTAPSPPMASPSGERVGVRGRSGFRFHAILLFLLAVTAHAATPPTNKPSTETQAFDKIVDATVARYHLPGIAVGVIEHGEVVYTRTAGETVAGSGQQITP
ncbi:MAG TPA: hypothetical protein VL097_00900, partial [Rhodanobacter sp.]|nr:hypothetical protein [Rhodanobacter sp.]